MVKTNFGSQYIFVFIKYDPLSLPRLDIREIRSYYLMNKAQFKLLFRFLTELFQYMNISIV